MSNSKITASQLDDFIRDFPAEAMKAAEIAMKAAVTVLHESLPGYPPPPEGSTYVRTGTLGRGWTESVEVTRPWEVVGSLGTNVPYAPWVVGPDFPGEEIQGRTMYQAKVHVDRWWQLNELQDESIEASWLEFDRVYFESLSQRFAEM